MGIALRLGVRAALVIGGLLAAVTAPRADVHFLEPRLLPGGGSPGALYIGVVQEDLDGDGRLDVAATGIAPLAGSGSTERRELVSVWLGNGDGTFQAPLQIDLGAQEAVGVAGIVAADLDGDGVPDLAAAAWRERAIVVLLGMGDGSFAAPASFGTGTVQAGSLQVADLDGDGDADLATAPALVDAATTTVAVLRGNGDGAFAAPTLHAVATFPADLVLADVDGASGPDLLVLSVSGTLSVLLNDGHGAFPAEGTPFPVRVDGRGLWAGDFDGDETLDVLVAGIMGTYGDVCGLGCIVTVHGNGDGTFAAPPVGNVRVTGAWPGRFYTAGSLAPDLDGDGHPDAYFGRAEGDLVFNEVTVMLSGAGGGESLTEWVASPGLPEDFASRVDGMGTFSAAAGDFDGDGTPDLVTTTAAGTGAGTVAYLPGVAGRPGTFAAPRLVSLSRGWGVARGLALGHVDAGPALDIVAITDALDAAKGDGDGAFGPAYTALGRVAGPGEFYDTLRLAELNGDGRVDALWLASDGVQGGPAPRHLVALGAGDGTFAIVAALPAQAGFAGQNAAVADLDGDTTADLAVLTYGVGGTVPYVLAQIEIWRNDGLGTAGSFTPGQVLVLQSGILFTASPALAAEDLDGDGVRDLVAHRFNAAGGDDLVLFRGHGDGTFLAPEVITSELAQVVGEIAAADVNGDANPDLVLAGGAAVTVLLGDGDGTFRPRTAASDHPSGIANGEVRIADLDGDGHPDLVVGANNGPAFHRGDGQGGFGPPHHLAIGCESGGLPLAVGDLDGDGLPDLVAGHPTGEPGAGPSHDGLTVVLNRSGPVAEVSMAVTCTPAPVHAGEPLACTFAVANGGPDPAAGVGLRAPPRLGATFVSWNPSQGACAQAGGALECALGAIPAGGSATAAVLLAPQRAGTLWVGASAGGATTDPRAQDNAAATTVTVLPASADLGLEVVDDPDPSARGASLTYTFTVRNAGPSAATGVVFTDALPAGVTFVSATSSAGVTQHAGSTVTAALGAIAPGGEATITVVVTPAVADQLANTGTVTALEADPDPANNAVTASTQVTAPVQEKAKGGGCGCGQAGAPDALAALFLAALLRRRA